MSRAPAASTVAEVGGHVIGLGPVKLIEVDILVEVAFGVFGRVMAVVPVDVSKHVKCG